MTRQIAGRGACAALTLALVAGSALLLGCGGGDEARERRERGVPATHETDAHASTRERVVVARKGVYNARTGRGDVESVARERL